MFKKILFPFILALVTALAIGGVAYAASQPDQALSPAAQAAPEDENPALAARRGLGQITALGENQFTVLRRNGAVQTIRVDENTRYFKADGSAGSFADLQVGRWVAGRVVLTGDGPQARLVIILPEGFDPTLKLIRHAGTITAVDPTAGTFSLRTVRGESLAFQTDGDTQYYAQVHSLADLQTGMAAIVGTQRRPDGSYLAVRVTAHEKPLVDVKKVGRVTAIDVSSFTIRARDGNTYTFQVTPQTRFRSRGGEVRGLRDLRLGMGVAVAAQETDGGQLRAVLVVAKVRK
jgi:Domain of unknown function (DUF5666)